jgi:alkylhydroperoxidase/carboxymuconolactone decarboxylase family protein YurZ
LLDCSLDRVAIYETILQSYLFLGFPRMIEAALLFNEIDDGFHDPSEINKISGSESDQWYNDGLRLIRQVYGENYDILRKRFMEVSPDIFRWMMIEGYGKVLSRPGLTHIERELAEVAALTVDRRERQLVSHIRGSLNMGADLNLVERVIEDIKPLAGDEGFALAQRLVAEIKYRYENKK